MSLPRLSISRQSAAAYAGTPFFSGLINVICVSASRVLHHEKGRHTRNAMVSVVFIPLKVKFQAASVWPIPAHAPLPDAFLLKRRIIPLLSWKGIIRLITDYLPSGIPLRTCQRSRQSRGSCRPSGSCSCLHDGHRQSRPPDTRPQSACLWTESPAGDDRW